MIDWCIKAYYDLPPCWSLEHFPAEQTVRNESKNYLADKAIDTGDNVISEVDSSQQRDAAHIKHKPVVDLKKECIYFWLQHQKLSNDHVAQKFYEGLSPAKQKLLSPSNATKTLSKAISQYKNREELLEKGKLPYWLINFNPENPQP